MHGLAVCGTFGHGAFTATAANAHPVDDVTCGKEHTLSKTQHQQLDQELAADFSLPTHIPNKILTV